jgi:replicative DNA helicase
MNPASQPDIEYTLLASLYQHPGELQGVRAIIKPEYWVSTETRAVFLAMCEADNELEEVNIVSLVARGVNLDIIEQLDKRHAGEGAMQLACVLAERYAGRLMLTAIDGIRSAIRTPGNDVAESLSALREVTDRAEDVFSAFMVSDAEKHLREYDDWIDRNASGEVRMIPTGFGSLDRALKGGFEGSDLNVIGGGPGTGKTSFVCNIMLNMLKAGVSVGMVQAEVKNVRLLNRMNAIYSGVDKDTLRRGEQYGEVTLPFRKWLSTQPFNLVMATKRNLHELRSAIDHLARRKKCQVIFLDFLQLFRSRGRGVTEYEAINEAVNMLKALAMRFNVCIIAIASLNRSKGKDGEDAGGRAGLHSFRGSGEIEFTASVAIQLQRISKDHEEAVTLIRKLDADVVKNREGRTGTITFTYDLPTQRVFESANEPGRDPLKVPAQEALSWLPDQ